MSAAESGSDVDDRDHLGQRRLTGRETAFWYGLAGVTYVGFGMFHKFLLNWIIGPVWLVVIVWFGPALVDLVRGRGGRRRGPS